MARVKPLTLDVADPQSISEAAAAVRADPGRLDVLVNNAGIGSDFGVAGVDPDFEAIQRALDTNFFGAYRLTIELLGLLRESPHPRIVNVSSGMGGVTEMGGWSPGYRVSKAALNAMTRILSTELHDAGFLVNSACPGFVNTDMGGPMGATKPVEDGAAGIVWLARSRRRRADRRLLPRRPARGVLSGSALARGALRGGPGVAAMPVLC